MKPVTERGMWIRGILYFVIGALSVLTTDASFRSEMGPLAISACTALVAGLVAVRAFIDTSTNDDGKPMEVTTPPGEPLETTEVSSEVPNEIPRTVSNEIPRTPSRVRQPTIGSD